MKYLLILLAIGFVMMPILKLRMRPADKLIMQLRNHAIKQGLQIQYAATPSRTTTASSLSPSIRYQLNFTINEQKSRTLFPLLQWTKSSNENGQQWSLVQYKGFIGKNKAWLIRINHILEQLPTAINAIELTSGYVGVYWQEEGSLQDISQIGVSLNQIKDLLLKDHPIF